jgi:hypothetical protein
MLTAVRHQQRSSSCLQRHWTLLLLSAAAAAAAVTFTAQTARRSRSCQPLVLQHAVAHHALTGRNPCQRRPSCSACLRLTRAPGQLAHQTPRRLTPTASLGR